MYWYYVSIMESLKLQKMAEKEKLKGRKEKAKKALKRLSQDSLYRDVHKVMQDRSIGSPAEYLATVMAGDDPRIDSSELLDIVDGVQDRGLDELPTLDEWIVICDIIRNNEMYTRNLVPIEHSNKAAEILSKHIYSQKTENQTKIDAKVEIVPLSKKEIKKFKKIFEKEY